MLKVKTKTCKICKTKFLPTYNTIQPCCSIPCLIIHGKAIRSRQDRLKTKERKDASKSLTAWLDEAQVVFNRWIRLCRDANEPCISCGTTKPVQYCAGHYRTRKAASQLRFNEDNVFKQCNSHCNRHHSGNIGAYREALLLKIGPERLAAIENDNTVKRWTIEEAKAIKSTYTLKLKALKRSFD